MKIYKISIIVFSLLSLSVSQQLSLSSDSLFLNPSPDYSVSADTLMFYNSGQEKLVIDSLISKNNYSYNLYVFNADTTFYYNVWVGIEPFYMELFPGDSATFIFYNPDLCTTTDPNYNFQDSIFAYSNSIGQEIYTIYATGIGMTDISDKPVLKHSYQLFKNYPNPFNSKTNIEFLLEKTSNTVLSIYNSLGQKVEILFSGKLQAGKHKFIFNGSNYSTGIYYYVLDTEKKRIINKMLLIE